MPQLIVEFSSNIVEKEKNNLPSLLKNFHAILANMLPTELNSCKSRAVECNIFCVGDGQANNAFVHVTVKVMPGRSHDILQGLGGAIMEQLRNHFAGSLGQLNLQITLEIIALQKTYFKVNS